jgi:hypothetical protein
MNNLDILNQLNENGIYKFEEPFTDGAHVERITQIADRHFFTSPEGEYEFGKACRIGSYEQHMGNAVYELFSNPRIWSIAQQFYGTSPSFNEIFLTHDYTIEQGLARNGWLHFDRIPTLKFFMYLTDCESKDGPFMYVPRSYKLGRQLREAAAAATNSYDACKNRLEVDYPELGYTKESAVPLTGAAGTMFIFHSDLFHCGGIVEEDSERKVIRMHLRQ